MKKLLSSTLAGILVVGLTSSGSAVPIGSGNNGMDYLFKGNRLKWLSAGVYMHESKRGVDLGNTGVSTTLRTRQQLAYLGIDAGRWLTIYGLGGASEARFGDGDYASSESVYGIGARFNVLDHEFMEPVMMEDRWRINLGVQYTLNETDRGLITWDWEELSVALTIGIVNDTRGNKYYTPESIVIYAGPIYSILDGSHFSEKDNMGVVVGAEFFFTDSLSIDIEVQSLDETSMGAGLNIRF